MLSNLNSRQKEKKKKREKGKKTKKLRGKKKERDQLLCVCDDFSNMRKIQDCRNVLISNRREEKGEKKRRRRRAKPFVCSYFAFARNESIQNCKKRRKKTCKMEANNFRVVRRKRNKENQILWMVLCDFHEHSMLC